MLKLTKGLLAKGVLAATLAATSLTAAPAQARDYYRGRGGDNDAALVIGAGVVGLAIGAAIASDNRGERYYDRGYYDRGYRGGYYSYPAYRDRYDSYPRYRGYEYRGWRSHDRREHGWHGHHGGW